MGTPQDEAEAELWQRAVDALLAKGATYAEAVDGANLILLAFRRKREEEAEKGAAPPRANPRGSEESE